VIRAAAFAFAVAALLGACQEAPPNASGGQGESTLPGLTSTDPSMTGVPTPTPTPDEATPAVIDAALLDYLPESVGGVPMAEELNEAASAVADPAVSRIASAVDVGFVVDQTTGNLVTTHVVRLREGAFDDDTYRQWRDSYDDGACAAAGGVVGRAEATIDERTVHVTSCVAGLRTYHVWIEDELLLISASSVGDGRFGELLMSELRVE
jgi:hypothetical protein